MQDKLPKEPQQQNSSPPQLQQSNLPHFSQFANKPKSSTQQLQQHTRQQTSPNFTKQVFYEQKAAELPLPQQVAANSLPEAAQVQHRQILDTLMKRSKQANARGKRKVATPQASLAHAQALRSLTSYAVPDGARSRSPQQQQQSKAEPDEKDDVVLLAQKSMPVQLAPLEDMSTQRDSDSEGSGGKAENIVDEESPETALKRQHPVQLPLPEEVTTHHISESEVADRNVGIDVDESPEAVPKRLRRVSVDEAVTPEETGGDTPTAEGECSAAVKVEELGMAAFRNAAFELSAVAAALAGSSDMPWERELLESLPAPSLLEQALTRAGSPRDPASGGENGCSAACLQVARMCREQHALWQPAMQRWERKLIEECHRAKEAAGQARPEKVLLEAKQFGATLGRALQRVADGVPGGKPVDDGALTLEDELLLFAEDCSAGRCNLLAPAPVGPGMEHSMSVCAEQVQTAANHLWIGFGGVQGYARYLKNSVQLPGAGLALSGGAAWHRLVVETEVATKLAHLPKEAVTDLDRLVVQLEGARALGGQTWEDVAQRLMLAVAMTPLQSAVHYAVSRMAWALKRQKIAATHWLETCGTRVTDHLYAAPRAQEPSPPARELVMGVTDASSLVAVTPLFHCLHTTIWTGCQRPHLLIRPKIPADMALQEQCQGALHCAGDEVSHQSRDKLRRVSAKQRVREEMKQRASAAKAVHPNLQMVLNRSFAELTAALARHIRALGNSALTLFANSSLDEALTALHWSDDQLGVLEARREVLEAAAVQRDGQVQLARRCAAAIVAAVAASRSMQE